MFIRAKEPCRLHHELGSPIASGVNKLCVTLNAVIHLRRVDAGSSPRRPSGECFFLRITPGSLWILRPSSFKPFIGAVIYIIVGLVRSGRGAFRFLRLFGFSFLVPMKFRVLSYDQTPSASRLRPP